MITSTGNPINVLLVSFVPRNEGEKATYTFSFVPTSVITDSNVIIFKFPSSYDKLVGSNI